MNNKGEIMALWEEIDTFFRNSKNNCQIIPGNVSSGIKDIHNLGISEDSLLGTIIVNTSGVFIDKWVRVLGQSSEQRVCVLDYLKREDQIFHGLVVVATDVVGGIFAINNGRFETQKGYIWYFGPDTLLWECLNVKYAEFIGWLVQGDLDSFYAKMRWHHWKEDTEVVEFNQGILLYPFLWAKECDVNTADKKCVPFEEIIGLNDMYANKFNVN